MLDTTPTPASPNTATLEVGCLQANKNPLAGPSPHQLHVLDHVHGSQQHFGRGAGNRQAIWSRAKPPWASSSLLLHGPMRWARFLPGWFGDRFGPKRVLTVIMTLWSATAVMTGAALGFGSLFGARFLLGLSESGAFPVASRGMQLWFPRVERGRIQGTTHFFSRFAVAVTPFIAGSISARLRMARNFLHFRLSWRCVGDCFQPLLPQPSRGAQRRKSDGAGPHPGRQPGWNH